MDAISYNYRNYPVLGSAAEKTLDLTGRNMINAEKEFIKYADRYKQYGEKIQLKTDHSLRVRDLCTDIAASLGLSEEEIGLASVCGLLHDIGRFEQWKQFGTYSDSRSVDHGDLGAKILQEDGLISTFSQTDHNTILRAVRYHNKYSVPGTLSRKNRLFTDITRNADKIDIIYCFITGELATHTKNTAISRSVYKTLTEGKMIRKHDIETKADEIAVRLAFVFDLSFKRSLEIMKENDYINRMIDVHNKEASNPELKLQLEDLRSFINEYINSKAIS